jgi:hypothetical protein
MPEGRKRSLSQAGGKCALAGDPERARVLAHCLAVDPGAKLRFTHGFHAYPARMHPETAERVLAAFPGGAVFDPFAGSGTTALEAVRAGRPFTGTDISRVPLEIAWVRTRVWAPERIRRMEQAALALSARAFAEPDVPLPEWARRGREWYDPHTLREIVVLQSLIDSQEEEETRRVLACVLSSIVVRLSKQISDSDVKADRFHRPRPRHAAYRRFRDKIPELASALLQLSSDLYKRKVEFREPDLRKADARTFVPPAPADLVVTSPPYEGTYDYALHRPGDTRSSGRTRRSPGSTRSARAAGRRGIRKTWRPAWGTCSGRFRRRGGSWS